MSSFLYFCSALYGAGLEEDEEEGEDDEDVELHRLPGLLFRRPPQLLQYTAALRSPYDSGDGGGGADGDDDSSDDGDYDNGEEAASAHRGELRLVSQIGTVPHTPTLQPGSRSEILMSNQHECRH